MLRRIAVGNLHHLVIVVNHDGFAVLESLGCYVLSGQQSQLTLHFSLHLLSRFDALANEQHLAVRAMFRLTEQVGSNESRIGCLVCQDLYFTGTGRHVDGNVVQTYLLLGTHHELVARTKYLIDLGNALRAVGHSTYGLYTADFVDTAHSGYACCDQNGRIDAAVLGRRRTEHDVLATRYLSRRGKHQNRTEQGCCAARDIEADALYGNRLLPAFHALGHLDVFSLEALGSMEAFYVAMSQTDGVLEFLADRSLCCKHLSLRDSQFIELHLVEAFLILTDRSITALPYILQDSGNRGIQLRSIPHRPLQQSIKFF